MNIITSFIQTILLIFIAVLPLKLTLGIGTPSFPAIYSGDFFTIFYSGWSPYVFTMAAAVLLLLSLFLKSSAPAPRQKRLRVFLLLWTAVLLTAFAGIKEASCKEYVRQTLLYLSGLVCFAGAAGNVLRNDPRMGRKIIAAIFCGALLAALAGWRQIFSGSGEMEQYLLRNGLTGSVSDAMLRQIRSSRVIGTFTICNTFAGYLAAILSATLFFTWSRYQCRNEASPLYQRYEFAAAAALALAGVIWFTGSRGAILSLFAGLFAVGAVFAYFHRKIRVLLFSAGGAILIGLILLLIFRRGLESVMFRLDYLLAALKMMLAHPFTGTGWGDFFHEYPRLKLLVNDETPHSPHNFVLFFGSQCGIAGFLAAFGILLYPLVIGFRRLVQKIRDHEPDALSFSALPAALVTISVNSLMEIGIESPSYACLMILLSILILSDTEHAADGPAPKNKIVSCCKVVLFLLFAAETLIASLAEIRRESAWSDLFLTVNPMYSENPSQMPSRAEYERCWARALQLEPENPFIYAAAGKYAEQHGDRLQAERLYSKAIGLAHEDASLYRMRLRVNPRTSDLQKIRDLEPNHPDWQKKE